MNMVVELKGEGGVMEEGEEVVVGRKGRGDSKGLNKKGRNGT